MIEKIKSVWNWLPSEIKVALYIALSYGLSELVVQLSRLEISNVWLAILINILLVFLKELKPRVDRLRSK